jgi:hypothetical protein
MDKNAVLAALNANKTTRKGLRLDNKRIITVKTTGDVTVKLAPQAITLLEIMYSQEATTWTEVQLHELFNQYPEITEKQTPWKIWKFYSKTLVDAGFVTIKG